LTLEGQTIAVVGAASAALVAMSRLTTMSVLRRRGACGGCVPVRSVSAPGVMLGLLILLGCVLSTRRAEIAATIIIRRRSSADAKGEDPDTLAEFRTQNKAADAGISEVDGIPNRP
jgi:hypothetical protein